jgi:hypothetical protein
MGTRGLQNYQLFLLSQEGTHGCDCYLVIFIAMFVEIFTIAGLIAVIVFAVNRSISKKSDRREMLNEIKELRKLIGFFI